jgi:hypothetical protein
MKLGMGTLEEHNYAHVPTFKLYYQTFNIPQVLKMVGVCTCMKTSKSSTNPNWELTKPKQNVQIRREAILHLTPQITSNHQETSMMVIHSVGP